MVQDKRRGSSFGVISSVLMEGDIWAGALRVIKGDMGTRITPDTGHAPKKKGKESIESSLQGVYREISGDNIAKSRVGQCSKGCSLLASVSLSSLVLLILQASTWMSPPQRLPWVFSKDIPHNHLCHCTLCISFMAFAFTCNSVIIYFLFAPSLDYRVLENGTVFVRSLSCQLQAQCPSVSAFQAAVLDVQG